MGDVSKQHQDMTVGIKKRFNSRRKVDSELIVTDILSRTVSELSQLVVEILHICPMNALQLCH